jgi:16S rRNA (uracil1498-N3)-methyltransferase
MVSSDKHIFAIHVPNFWNETSKVESTKKLVDHEKDCASNQIVHRLLKVLRIEVGQKFIFFDKLFHGIIEILDISKKDLVVKILSFEKNSKSSPEIVFLLPLLKKEALEEAVYSLTEIGVSQIQLVVTQKSRQKLLHEKEFHRLESIIIAAAEQSKNYVFPKIFPPKDLFGLTLDSQSLKVVFDPQGQSFFDLRAKNLPQEKIYLLVGSEAGLTLQELQELENLAFEKCYLTPTILRAVQAVAVGASLFKI